MQRIREGLNMNIFQKIREYFPCVKERIFLNHAGVSPLCIPVSEAIQGYLKNKVSGEEEDFDVDSARKLFAQLINASSEEVALVPNTSTGLSIAANLLKYPRSSNVVTTDLEFPSVVYPWLRIKMISNLEIRYVKNIKGRLRLEDFEKAVNDDTVAVVISHVEYGNGFKNDLKAIAEIAHEHGALIVVDACQSAGAMNIDVKRQEIDFLATSCYKWLLGPSGAGFLYVKRDLIEEAEPIFVGWASVKHEIFETVDLWNNTQLVLSETARRFEIGTPSLLSYVGATAALELILKCGIEKIENRIMELTNYLIEKLKEDGFTIQTPQDSSNRSGIVNFKTSKPKEKVEKLHQKGVIVSARMNGIRVSPHFYNTKDDLERFLEYLKEIEDQPSGS